MPWDANIPSTQFKGKLPLQSFNQLQLGNKERCLGAGVSVPAIFNSDMAKFEMLPLNWFSTFQSTMTTLIPLYVNHNDNSGNWNGQATIPTYTEATMLTAIGDSSRIPAPSAMSHRICSAWCYQQYKMLNMMRWRKTSVYYETQIRCEVEYSYPIEGTYEQLRADLIALPNWNAWEPQRESTQDAFLFRKSTHQHFLDYGESPYIDIRIKRLTVDKTAVAGFPQFTWDGYSYASAIPDGPYNKFFQVNGNARNVYSLNKSSEVESLFAQCEFPGNHDEMLSAMDAAPYVDGSYYIYSIPDAYPCTLILKFTGSNGFTMKDW